MSGAAFGTLAWVRDTGGVMSRRERLGSVARGLAAVIRNLPARVRHDRGLGSSSGVDLEPSEIPVPDSALARGAERLCAEASSPLLANHCHRSYLWGMLLARAQRLDPDPEVLYLAALLHDLGLTDDYAHRHEGIACFAGQGGESARAFASENGWDDRRAEAVGDAISLHLNVTVAAEHGPEAQLLQQGAALDVIGMRHWLISPQTAAAVVAKHPREGFKRGFAPVLCTAAKPGTRANLLHDGLKFPKLIARTPFDD